MRHPCVHRFLLNLMVLPVSNWRWYRKWQGGHWERWYIEACWSDLWLDYLACTRDTGDRPGTGRGTPTCETWP